MSNRNRSKPLKPGQKWLLSIAHEQHKKGIRNIGQPGGFTGILNTVTSPEPVSMCTVRGLIRRGYLEEKKQGFFYITEDGISALGSELQIT